MTTDEVRKAFIDFFVERDHRDVPSDSLVPPAEDKSLLFTGAGMNQFKAEFTGRGEPGFARAATSQKCLRTADLDNVGRTAYHHTFFEMLGNFSFGDYFKQDAIAWTWEFLVDVLGLPKEQLRVSVHNGDGEAFAIWENEIGVRKDWIYRYDDHENFWPADCPKEGPNGLCGPCSEIFFDWGPEVGCGRQDCEPSCDCGRFCEVWNLVFQQYDRKDVGVLEQLPTKNIDTGMGLERIAAVMQGKMNNYEIDIFTPVLREIEREVERPYESLRDGEAGSRFRRIADHVRASAFCIGDGILPGRTGRGYVLRKMIRRAVRDAIFLGREEPMLYRLVPVIAEVMPTYPELKERRENIGRIIRIEEERFHATLKRGASILDELVDKLKESGSDVLAGQEAFRLFDTYGFSAEDAESMLDEAGVRIDMEGFHKSMEEQRKRSRAGSDIAADIFGGGPLADLKARLGETEFLGCEAAQTDAEVVGIIRSEVAIETAEQGAEVAVVLDKTTFYGEAGGEVGDTGIIAGPDAEFQVSDTQRGEGMIIHLGKITRGALAVGATVTAIPDAGRQDAIRRNHTATHLLHKALRTILGEHVEQAGSLVAPDHLRFDFSHMEALTPAQLECVEEQVNRKALENLPLDTAVTSLEDARSKGAMALFGEKYGEQVRMVSISDWSRELCGGLHCQATGQIGLFKILSEGSVAAGVRRIEAVTGLAALAHVRGHEQTVQALSKALKAPPDRLPEMVAQLRDQVKALRKEVEESRKRGGVSAGDLLSQGREVGETAIVAANLGDVDADELRATLDRLRRKTDSLAAVLGAVSDGKPFVVIGLTRDLVRKGLSAGNFVAMAGQAMGGGGGGRPDLAQAGGKDAAQLDEAIQVAAKAIEASLS